MLEAVLFVTLRCVGCARGAGTATGMATGAAAVDGVATGMTGMTGISESSDPPMGVTATGNAVVTGIVAAGADGTICTAVSGGNAVLCAVPPQPMAATRPNIADVDMPAVRIFHA